MFSHITNVPIDHRAVQNFYYSTFEGSAKDLDDALNGKCITYKKLHDEMEMAFAKIAVSAFVGGISLLIFAIPVSIYGINGASHSAHVSLIVFENVCGAALLGSIVAATIFGLKFHRLYTQKLSKEKIESYKQQHKEDINKRIVAAKSAQEKYRLEAVEVKVTILGRKVRCLENRKFESAADQLKSGKDLVDEIEKRVAAVEDAEKKCQLEAENLEKIREHLFGKT